MSHTLYEFTAEAITPMYLSGNDMRRFDLRAPSLRGGLRYWFRAMMGDVLQGDWIKVHRLEGLVFGDTHRASPVRVMLSETGNSRNFRQWQNEPVPPGRDRKESFGVKYLGFSLYRQGKTTREGVKPGYPFRIALGFDRNDQVLHDVVIGSLWLLAHYGGIGSRSRRGFGSFAVKPAAVTVMGIRETTTARIPYAFSLPGAQRTALSSYFEDTIAAIKARFCAFAAKHMVDLPASSSMIDDQNLPKFPCFMAWQSVVVRPRNGAWNTWVEAMDAAGYFFRAFRAGRVAGNANGSIREQSQDSLADAVTACTPDYTQVVNRYMPDWSQERRRWERTFDPKQKWQLRNPIFGLPLQYRSTHRPFPGKNMTASVRWRDGENTGDGNGNDRRSSPLFIRVLKLPDNTYGILMIALYSQFVPDRAMIRLGPPQVSRENRNACDFLKGIGSQPIQLAGYRVMDEFFAAARAHFAVHGEWGAGRMPLSHAEGGR
ncbi:type III-B CRISPR module RAMP protein Cmr1 [Heliophilum fasciatum]|uniref:CRISPR type III-B/RAMP module RAMP protein Cmr1 n=1 Tax=Heliophilum fasciatum TaxID=35700 RepID=A0A4R2RM74_9FIRM|nr:type III-B CRISPR module RAMP protein Cmr1 [Heliophilum fasciatum]MCW2279324.1 CRISPR type III-B/RAMP module RAMP protein Cmr1 [Heliophilum fasciatum]TCP60305.1 CRISPR type III-B/RAMP module RAMP protein Cmr1 [Heliophilum fasciatum]